MSIRKKIEETAKDITEAFGLHQTFVMNGPEEILARALPEAIFSGFLGSSEIVLFVALGDYRACSVKNAIQSFSEFDNISSFQITRPYILEQLMDADFIRFQSMIGICGTIIVWINSEDIIDNTLEYWFNIQNRLPKTAHYSYFCPVDFNVSILEKHHPGIQKYNVSSESLNIRPIIYQIPDTASPETLGSSEYWSKCRNHQTLVNCRSEHCVKRYSEASHRNHIRVFDLSSDIIEEEKNYQGISPDVLSEFNHPDESWNHFAVIDPLPGDDVSDLAANFVGSKGYASILTTNCFSLLNSLVEPSKECLQQDVPGNRIVQKAYCLFSLLQKNNVSIDEISDEDEKQLLQYWKSEGLVSSANGTFELSNAGRRIFAGIQSFSQLGILHGWHHPTRCQTMNHQNVGWISSDFLRLDISNRFSFAGQLWQKKFHNVLGNEATLQMDPSPAKCVWLDAMPVICSSHHASLIQQQLFSDKMPEHVYLDEESHETLIQLRQSFKDVPSHDWIEVGNDCAHWWTFAGAFFNTFTARLLQHIAPKLIVSYGNFHLRLSWSGQCSVEQIVRRIKEIVEQIRGYAIYGFSESMESFLLKELSRFYTHGWCFPLLSQPMILRILRDMIRSWSLVMKKPFSIVAVEKLHLIDENLPLVFDKSFDEIQKPIKKVNSVSKSIQSVAVSLSEKQHNNEKMIKLEHGHGERMVTHYPWSYVSTQHELSRAIGVMLKEKFIGLDVETTLYDQSLCLVQIGCSCQTFLIDPFMVEITDLSQVFSHPEIVKVIHNASFEKKVLGNLGFQINNICDTMRVSQKVNGFRCEGGHSLKAVCLREFGYEMDKENQKSRWERRPLSPEQLEYAALDAEIMIHLYRHFNL